MCPIRRCFLRALHPFLRSAFLLSCFVPSGWPQTKCPSPIFRPQRWANGSHQTPPSAHRPNALHFFALTQDCQFVIARPDQLGQLSSLRVDRHRRECHASRVQLLWSLSSAQPSLLLLQKRSAHELCILPVEMPTPLAVFGAELFSYSLRSALARFAKCSRWSQAARQAEPQLMFPDSLYSDIFYQLRPSHTTATDWTVQQLKLTAKGHIRPADEQFQVQPMAPGLKSSSVLLLATDAQRRRLFAVPKQAADPKVHWTCPFDLLFRPAQAEFRSFPLFPGNKKFGGHFLPAGSVLTGLSVDRNIAAFTVERAGTLGTELFLAKLPANAEGQPETRCVLRTQFGLTVGVISAHTLKQLDERGPLPSMGEQVKKVDALGKARSTKQPTTRVTVRVMPNTTARPTLSTTTKSGKTAKTTPILYFWHRSTPDSTPMTNSSSSEQQKGATHATDEADWDEDYAEHQEEDQQEEEEEELPGDEATEERILPLAGEDGFTPAQMVKEEAASTKEPASHTAGAVGRRASTTALLALCCWAGLWLLFVDSQL